MRILHASTFPDVHLCGVNTSRLQKKNTPSKTMPLHQHYLRMRIRWVAIISHRQEVCMWDLPQVCGHPRKLSLGCPGSSFQFYPFSCQSCRIEQCFLTIMRLRTDSVYSVLCSFIHTVCIHILCNSVLFQVLEYFQFFDTYISFFKKKLI